MWQESIQEVSQLQYKSKKTQKCRIVLRNCLIDKNLPGYTHSNFFVIQFELSILPYAGSSLITKPGTHWEEQLQFITHLKFGTADPSFIGGENQVLVSVDLSNWVYFYKRSLSKLLLLEEDMSLKTRFVMHPRCSLCVTVTGKFEERIFFPR